MPRYGEEDLSKGEMVCVDRCVSKFFKTNLRVGSYMRESGNGPDSLASFRSVAANAGSNGSSTIQQQEQSFADSSSTLS